MPDLILHHYPSSPFSEKIRLVLGYKKLAWKSVIIPADHAQARRAGAHRRLSQDADPAGGRRHLLRHGLDLRRAGARAARAHAVSAAPARACRGCSPSGPTPRCSGPRWPTTCSPRARRTCFAKAPPEAAKAFGEDRKAMSGNMVRLRPADATSAYRSYLRRIAHMVEEHDFLFGTDPCVADFATYHSLWYTRVQVPVLADILERHAGGGRVDGPHGGDRPRRDGPVRFGRCHHGGEGRRADAAAARTC